MSDFYTIPIEGCRFGRSIVKKRRWYETFINDILFNVVWFIIVVTSPLFGGDK